MNQLLKSFSRLCRDDDFPQTRSSPKMIHRNGDLFQRVSAVNEGF